MRWYRRRKQRLAAARAARLLVALDALAGSGARPRRLRRGVVGAAR